MFLVWAPRRMNLPWTEMGKTMEGTGTGQKCGEEFAWVHDKFEVSFHYLKQLESFPTDLFWLSPSASRV